MKSEGKPFKQLMQEIKDIIRNSGYVVVAALVFGLLFFGLFAILRKFGVVLK